MKGKKQVITALSSVLLCQQLSPWMTLVNAQPSKGVELQQSRQIQDFHSVIEYWKAELLGDLKGLEEDADIQACVKQLDQKAQQYLDTMLEPSSSEHLWADDAYNNAQVGAKITESLDRLKMISIQIFEPTSVLYQNQEAIKKVNEALQFILGKKYGPDTVKTNSNWWDWEIGAPKALVDTTILMYDYLSAETIEKVTKTIDRFVPKADYRLHSSLKETGANLIDKVAIVIKRAALDNNEERMYHAKQCISPLFSYSNTGDGYYPDGSFIQHGNIPYNGSYGYVLLNELTNCIIMLSFTDFAVEAADIEFYEHTLLKHYIPFLSYGGNMVDSVRGRAVSRKAQQGDTMGVQTMGVLLQYADVAATENTKQEIYTQLKGIVESKFKEVQTQDFSLLAYADYARVKNLKEHSAIQAMARNSFSVYSYMDRVVSNRKDFTFTLSANSSRMCTEQGNSENILGRYQGQGYTQIYNDDINQYNEDYNATVDQKRLAGVTSAHQDLGFLTSGQSKWSGGVTLDGIHGASGFELTGNKQLTQLKGGFGSEQSTGVKSGITAKKSYFVFGDKIVYLGSSISNLGYDPNVDFVESIVENRKAFDGMQLSVDGQTVVKENGAETIQNPTSAYLTGKSEDTGIGYVFLEDMDLDVKKETRTGTWNDVNKLAKFTDHTKVSNDFISMAVNHGNNPTNDTYSWVTLPNASKAEVEAYKHNPTIDVIENSANVQAVKDLESKQAAYNFFAAGQTKDQSIKVNGPASIVLQETKDGYRIAVSDPTRTQDSVELTIKGNANFNHVGVVDGNAELISIHNDTLTIRVNFSSKDGQSRIVTFGTVFESTSENLALHKTATASSVVQNAVTSQRTANFATDGDMATRWASNYERSKQPISALEADTGWLAVDLGKEVRFNQVNIRWEYAVSNDYEIQISNDTNHQNYDEKAWISVATVKEHTKYKEEQRSDEVSFATASARFIRIKSKEGSRPKNANGEAAGGLSIYEFEVYDSINLVDSVEQANQLLKEYAEETAFINPQEFAPLKQALEQALEDATALINAGANYHEQVLQSIAIALNQAIKAYDQAILHVTGIQIEDLDHTMLDKGDVKKLTATISPANAYQKEIIWTSSDPRIATVDQEGNVTGVSSGNVTITATSKDRGFFADIALSVVVRPKKITLEQTSIEMKKGEQAQLNAKISPIEAAGSPLSFTSTDTSIAIVDTQGKITAVGVGTTNIVISSKDNPGLMVVCDVHVKANFVVNSENLALIKGAKATASSTVSATGVTPAAAADGSYTTRWASDYKNISEAEAETQWWMLELPEAISFNHIDLSWFSETVYGKEYKILVSEDGVNWQEAYHETDGKNKKYGFDFATVRGRWIRFEGIKRSATNGGYGIVEFEIYQRLDYDEIMTKAKAMASLYPAVMTGEQDAYEQLMQAIANAETLVNETPNFEEKQLSVLLQAVNQACETYQQFIVPVTGIRGTQMNLLAGKSTLLAYTITPETATNKEVIYVNKNPELVSIDEKGTVTGIKKGEAVIQVTTKDGSYTTDVKIHVASNTAPVISAHDVTVLVNHTFDPLQYASAMDEEDGVIPLTLGHIIKNSVDTSKEGQGSVTYQVVDQDGNMTVKTIIVTVEKDKQLENAIELLNSVIKSSDDIDKNLYTSDSWSNLEKALTQANDVRLAKTPTIEEVESARKQLMDAISQLILKQDSDLQPINPETSNQENANATKQESVGHVATGDNTNQGLFTGLVGLSLLWMGFVLKRKKQKE